MAGQLGCKLCVGEGPGDTFAFKSPAMQAQRLKELQLLLPELLTSDPSTRCRPLNYVHESTANARRWPGSFLV